MKKYLFIFFLLVSGSVFANVGGPNNQYYIVHDYQDDWQVYDNQLKLYIPYIAERHFDLPTHTVFCNVEENRNYKLLILAEGEDNFLFINGSLRRKIPKGKWVVMKVDSLFNVYKKPTIYLTIYGSKDPNQKKIYIGNPKEITPKNFVSSGISTGLIVKPRNILPFKSNFVIISVVLLVFFSYLSNSFHRAFLRFYNPRDLFTFLIRETSFLINKPLSRMNVMFVVLLSMIISLFYMLLLSRGIYLFGGRLILQEGETVGVLLSNYFRLSLITFAFFMAKYFFIRIIANLFNLDKTVDIHYFKIVQSSIIFFTFVTFLLLSFFLGYIPNDLSIVSFLYFPFILFYAIRFAIIYFTINRTIPIQSLYLFSYLCIVELIPIIIGIRFSL